MSKFFKPVYTILRSVLKISYYFLGVLARAAPSNWIDRPFTRVLDGHACHNFFHGKCVVFYIFLSNGYVVLYNWRELYRMASKGGISRNLATV